MVDRPSPAAASPDLTLARQVLETEAAAVLALVDRIDAVVRMAPSRA